MKNFFLSTLFFLVILILGFSNSIFAQQFPTEIDQFGKNRVQYQTFDWKYITSDNFEIYYYEGGYEMALLTARYAESDFGRMTQFLGFAPYNKTKIFVYRSIGELQQSNIGINDQDFNIGGQTNLGKSVVEIAFSEYREAYRKELLREISNSLLSEMMYGGSLKETLQSSFLLSLPNWLMSGAAAYTAEGWNTEMDNFVRSNLMAKKFPYPESFKDKNAQLVGQSIWNFIVEEYGQTTVSNILNLTRIVKSEKQGIQGTLGIEYDTFLKRWEAFYRNQYKDIDKYATFEKSNLIVTSSQYIHHPRFSPDGNYLVYAENNQGKFRIYVEDKNSKKKKSKKFIKDGLFVINQRYDENSPLLSWKNNSELGILSYSKSNYYLKIYNLKGKETKSYQIKTLENIQSFSFDERGKQIVLSATQRGKSDIFTFDLASARLSKITDDSNDDIDPYFLKNKSGENSNQIVFSSNRISDSLKTSPSIEQSPYFNLFVYNPAEKHILKQLTNQNSSAKKPISIDENHILYLTEELGIRHLFLHTLSNEEGKIGVNAQISSFFVGIEDYDYDLKTENLAFVIREQKELKLLTATIIPKHKTFTGKTYRNQLLDARFLKKLRSQQEKEEQDNNSIDLGNDNSQSSPSDTTKIQKEKEKDNYNFDTYENTTEPTRKKRLLKDYDYFAQRAKNKENQKITVRGPLEYHNKFAFERSVTTIALDPLRNFGILLEVSMSDALENHKLEAGLFNRGFFDIQSGMLFAEYKYLKNRIDYGARFDRQGYELLTPYFIHRYYLSKLSGTISYPLNVTTRIVLSPFVAQKQFFATSEINPAVQAFPDKITRYGGASAEFVFDNSTITGPNTLEGTKFRATIDHYQGLNYSNETFTNISIDARHYIPLGRKVTLAARFAYGKSFGNAPKNFRLGGVDNWIFQRQPNPDELSQTDPFYLDTNEPTAFVNDYSDYLFLRYVTPMRGFDYNKLSGNNFLLTNIELRVPIAQLLYKGTIRSPFFQNLQFIAFNDIGSAWTGISPFNRENSLNTVEVGGQEGNPFYAKVSNFKDPFLWGYGIGVRTKIFNYFTRFDTAWGVDDGVTGNAKFYLSVGYDF
ncbi:PD40 domain-containing protein [Bernardetia litoralis]|nr:PD40 domain-containing protein [Bernardetia litoralis]